jgi:hypothetical protein
VLLSELLKAESQVVIVDILAVFEIFTLVFNPSEVGRHSLSYGFAGLHILLGLINNSPKTRT